MPRRNRTNRRGPQPEVRIIGGQWRRRRIPFADLPGLRPTPDRVRETLFNWLQPILPGCRVLDLYAGSGCLGFEALSRGAVSATLVDSSSQVITALYAAKGSLGADSAEIVQANALQWLQQLPPASFDLVFVDPPYALDLYESTFDWLTGNPWLSPGALIYVETEKDAIITMPPHWSVIRQMTAGNLVATLLESH